MHSLEMIMLAMFKRFNFCLNNTNDSDMAIFDGSWFQVLIVKYEKIFALINVSGDMS